ncbi:PE-PPE domain-containing protein [Mycobacterium sp. CnD-18-1]|uniref:PE-PPE domain-containing protein n=1 Tax=Mycobacterium sp. CnD-18-1 TaxID=2917744 RepID=UPI001EF1E723|nr:PE-PPE domain-containing protein [Mycobacterium sp. CnD-18-1]MCG7607066.1 cutinase family protein [Mycobacterium sp. CnD-18-1]
MLARFRSYALAADGGPLKVDSYYGLDDADVQREYERRTGQVVDGIVSDQDLMALGLTPKKVVIFTVAGTGANWDATYPYDLARWQDQERVVLQPIGYPAAMFPMGPSVNEGIDELVRQMAIHLDGNDLNFILIGYSQGALVTSKVLQRMMGGDLARYLDRCIAGVTFGNPCRERGHYVGVNNPGGQGLDPNPLKNTPTWWYDYATVGDIYADGPGNDDHEAAEHMTAIFQAVQGHLLTGQDNLFEQVVELFLNPFREAPAAMKAIASGIGFFTANPPTAPHIEYSVRECVPGVTYFDHAMDYVRRVLIANARIS